MGERTTYIETIYKPPSVDCNVFIDSIQNILSTINQNKIYNLICTVILILIFLTETVITRLHF